MWLHLHGISFTARALVTMMRKTTARPFPASPAPWPNSGWGLTQNCNLVLNVKIKERLIGTAIGTSWSDYNKDLWVYAPL